MTELTQNSTYIIKQITGTIVQKVKVIDLTKTSVLIRNQDTGAQFRYGINEMLREWEVIEELEIDLAKQLEESKILISEDTCRIVEQCRSLVDSEETMCDYDKRTKIKRYLE